MKKIVLAMISILAVLALAACQAPANTNINPNQPMRQISASGEGKVYLTPDIAYIFIGVHSQNKSVADALKDNNSKAQAIAAALKSQGVDPKDIQTSSFNITPQPQTGPQGESTGEVSYNVDNTVNVTVRDLTKFGGLLEAVITAGANSINSIQFDVKDKEQAQAQAQQMAIENAKKQAASIAKDAGITLGAISNVNISTPPNPIPMYEGKGGGAINSAVPVAAGQMVIIVDASVTYEIK